MFLLIAEFARVFEVLMDSGSENLTATINFLFHHAKWEGLHFWDLVQPFFMFIVGVSIPLSYDNRKKKGDSEKQIRNHAFRRSFLLLFFGWVYYCVGPEKIVFQFFGRFGAFYAFLFFLFFVFCCFGVAVVVPAC